MYVCTITTSFICLHCYVYMFIHHSINVLTCQLYTSAKKVGKAVEFVIDIVRTTGRRSVLAVPLARRSSLTLIKAVEKAVKENIVVVTSAGKK